MIVGPRAISHGNLRWICGGSFMWLCNGGAVLPTLNIAAGVCPVFMLDAMRTGGALSFGAEAFDNRSKTFP